MSRGLVWLVAAGLVSGMFAQNIYRDGRLISGNDGRGGSQGYGPGRTVNFHKSSELRRPWAGSDTYDKNLGRNRADDYDNRVNKNVNRTLDTYHNEENRARRMRESDRLQAEKEQTVRANKAAIEAKREQAEARREARERAQLDEIRDRAAEQEWRRNKRQDEQAAKYDRIVEGLKPCAALEANGKPCSRMANPGIPYCYKHVGYQPPEKGK